MTTVLMPREQTQGGHFVKIVRDWSVGTASQEHQIFEGCTRSLDEERKDSAVSEQGLLTLHPKLGRGKEGVYGLRTHTALPELSFRT